MKRCNVCGEEKPVSEFYKHGKYVSQPCKACSKNAPSCDGRLRKREREGWQRERRSFLPRSAGAERGSKMLSWYAATAGSTPASEASTP